MILPDELENMILARKLSPAHLCELAHLGRLKEYNEGAVLFEEDSDSPYIYFVLSGQVSLQVKDSTGESFEIDSVGQGELLGWSPVFGRRAMTASARTVSACRLAVFDAEQISKLCDRDPTFGMAFLRQIGLHVSARLRSTRRALAQVRSQSHLTPYSLRHEGSD